MGDRGRSKYRANAALRLLRLWEQLRRRAATWMPITDFHARRDYAEQRWVRRNFYTLEQAGLLEVRRTTRKGVGGAAITEIRLTKQGKQL